MTLPFELQRMIFQAATECDSLGEVDKETAGVLRLVNSEVKRFVEPLMFRSFTIRSKKRLADFLKLACEAGNDFMLCIRRLVILPRVLNGEKELLKTFPSAEILSLRIPMQELVVDFDNYNYRGNLDIARNHLLGLTFLIAGLQCRSIGIVNHPVDFQHIQASSFELTSTYHNLAQLLC